MKYFMDLKEKYFYKLPSDFNKYSNKNFLKYALGANLYMNSLKDIYSKIMNGDFKNIASITICFEDSVRESDLKICEDNTIIILDKLYNSLRNKEINFEDIPLIFMRVRNINQFIDFSSRLSKHHAPLISGFVFPKFNAENAIEYLEHTRKLSNLFNEIFYVMPILESENIIYKETRMAELIIIKDILDRYKDIILNIRVGGTDFSSKFALRRSVHSNIYEVRVVGECLIDIVNIFLRESSEYIISAPVWEYFSDDINSVEVQGLLNELRLDKENGFCGKTVIHPKQARYVNIAYIVSYEEYIDAINIIDNSKEGGVFKGCSDNKMNEVLPHLNWAKKIVEKAEVYGVLNKGVKVDELYLEGNF